MNHRFESRMKMLQFYESEEFKEAEKVRREASKPTEHEYMDEYKQRVYCPVYDEIRPTWMCNSEHGDRDPQMDMDREIKEVE